MKSIEPREGSMVEALCGSGGQLRTGNEFGCVFLSVMVSWILFVSEPSANACLIQISNQLTGGSWYTTTTVGGAIYHRYLGHLGTIAVPPSPDVNVTPTLLTDADHPVFGRPVAPKKGKVGKLWTVTPLGAYEGRWRAGGQEYDSLGTATQTFNIAGTFRIIPEPGDVGPAKLKAQGMIDGEIGVRLRSFGGPPSASFSASISIEGLGTATASAGSTGTITETVGVTGTISKEPGATWQFGKSVQVTTSGTGPVNFWWINEVPLNVDLSWNFTMTLQAKNADHWFSGRSLAWSILRQQFVNLTPECARPLSEDPFFSTSVFKFDSTTNELRILHPNAALGEAVEPVLMLEEDGSPSPYGPSWDFSAFLPEVEAVIDENYEASASDGLMGSLINYPTMIKVGSNPDGTISFSGGTIEFVDAASSSVLAEGLLTNILADPANEEFTAEIRNFQLVNLLPGESPLADLFVSHGGAKLWFDSDIISDSAEFTADATSPPAEVEGTKIPEPAALGLLLLGSLVFLSRRK